MWKTVSNDRLLDIPEQADPFRDGFREHIDPSLQLFWFFSGDFYKTAEYNPKAGKPNL